jgi:hypothetical protein
MKNPKQRLRAIELSLTPPQIVSLWFKKSKLAGTLADVSRQSPFPREAVANAVADVVRNNMKGQPEILIERAVLQARQQADVLFNLIVRANLAIHENALDFAREYLLLCGLQRALRQVRNPVEGAETLRLGIVSFFKRLAILDSSISQIASGHFENRSILFSDSEKMLDALLKMAHLLSILFSEIAGKIGVAEISLESVRSTMQSKIDEEASSWISLARLFMFAGLGEEKDFRVLFEKLLTIPKQRSTRSAALRKSMIRISRTTAADTQSRRPATRF